MANGFWKQYHNILTALSPALYDATVELIGDWWNEMRNWEIVKILKRNVDTQSKNMIRYGERLADLEAKYGITPSKDEISTWRKGGRGISRGKTDIRKSRRKLHPAVLDPLRSRVRARSASPPPK